ncbi:putative membrane protein YhjE [Lentibacillus sp. JNUCC-1]|nr:putative membrane protein YhjE [Lentibacillus sp. JNUCC-1]
MPVMNIITNLKFMYENDELDEYIFQLLNDYESLGPLPGILLPLIEAFLPFLPLVVFVIANGAAYGLVKGFLWSWIGASGGAIGVFLLVQKLGTSVCSRQSGEINKLQRSPNGWSDMDLVLYFY